MTPIYNVDVTLQVPEPVKRVYLAPTMEDLPFTQEGGAIRYRVPVVECHQMVVIDYIL